MNGGLVGGLNCECDLCKQAVRLRLAPQAEVLPANTDALGGVMVERMGDVSDPIGGGYDDLGAGPDVSASVEFDASRFDYDGYELDTLPADVERHSPEVENGRGVPFFKMETTHGVDPGSQSLVRRFDTGATRDLDATKLDYEAFLCPAVLQRFAEYMHSKRAMADGTLRDGDNWQKGIPAASYVKSLIRHMHDVWKLHRGLPAAEDEETALCAIMFNSMGKLHEVLKAKRA